MRHTNLRVLVPALVPALVLPALLAGCSGSDGPSVDPSADPSTSGSPSTGADGDPSATPTQVGALVKKCRADVTITGDVMGDWKGPGEVRLRNDADTGDGPQATYVSEHGKYQLFVYTSGPGFEKSATLAVKGAGYTTLPDVTTDLGLTAAASGKKASVDVDLDGADGSQARLQASFTCKGPQ